MPDLEFPFVPYPYLIKLIITFFHFFQLELNAHMKSCLSIFPFYILYSIYKTVITTIRDSPLSNAAFRAGSQSKLFVLRSWF